MASDFLKTLRHGFLPTDGATGTWLLAHGRKAPLETLNLDEPDAVVALHGSYLKAGAKVLLTHTFSLNPLRWRTVSGRGDCVRLLRAAAANLRRAVGKKAFAAGAIGPSGLTRKAIAALDAGALEANFAVPARELARGGVDLLWLETFTNLPELDAALRGIGKTRSCAKLPVVTCVSPARDGSLADGTPLETWAAFLERHPGVRVIGANCGIGPRGFKSVLNRLVRATSKPLALKLNAGLPRRSDGNWVYPLPPAAFARAMFPLLSDRVRLVGGCCGTTPAHVARLAAIRHRG